MKQNSKQKPKAAVFAGLGLNCEHETAAAFRECGAEADIIQLFEAIERPQLLRRYNILAVPGGFSYGDDTGSGKAYGNRFKENLGAELQKFLSRDTLMIGICNGFQILSHAKLVPGALVHNDSRTYQCRWVDLKVVGESPWLQGITTLSVPIAHGEGKYVDDEQKLAALFARTGEAVLQYVEGPFSKPYGLPYNPNGALHDIAGVTSHGGRVLGLMPHPERGFFFTHRPDWTLVRDELLHDDKKMPLYADGQKIFSNAVRYFQ